MITVSSERKWLQKFLFPAISCLCSLSASIEKFQWNWRASIYDDKFMLRCPATFPEYCWLVITVRNRRKGNMRGGLAFQLGRPSSCPPSLALFSVSPCATSSWKGGAETFLCLAVSCLLLLRYLLHVRWTLFWDPNPSKIKDPKGPLGS